MKIIYDVYLRIRDTEQKLDSTHKCNYAFPQCFIDCLRRGEGECNG